MKNYKDGIIVFATAVLVTATLAVLKHQGYGFTWWEVTSPLWGLAAVVFIALIFAVVIAILYGYYDKD